MLHTVNVIYNISLERVRKVFQTFTFQLLHTIVVIMTFITWWALLGNSKISCIPNNMEKYISCSLDSLRLIYSLQFLNATLDTVVSKLSKEGGSKFQNVSKHYPIQSERDLLRKGVYSDYMSSWNRFHDQELPPISKLANKLSDSEVSDVDGKHLACALWEIIMICI